MNLLTHQFETSKCKVLVVNLPQGAFDITVKLGRLWAAVKDGEDIEYELPPSKWEILNLTEEKAREVVESRSHLFKPAARLYRDYMNKKGFPVDPFTFHTAQQSYESLIKANVKTVNKYGEKPNFLRSSGFNTIHEYNVIKDRWQAEQATVFDNYIILISKK